MSEWIAWAPSALLALVAVVLAVTLTRLRASTHHELAAAHADSARLRHRLDEVERLLESSSVHSTAEPDVVVAGVIASAGSLTEPRHRVPDRRIDGSLLPSLVVRETVVKGASLLHGLRRALSPETRNRIRFEIRQEVKRSRTQRRIDLRDARRQVTLQQRAAAGGST